MLRIKFVGVVISSSVDIELYRYFEKKISGIFFRRNEDFAEFYFRYPDFPI